MIPMLALSCSAIALYLASRKIVFSELWEIPKKVVSHPAICDNSHAVGCHAGVGELVEGDQGRAMWCKAGRDQAGPFLS